MFCDVSDFIREDMKAKGTCGMLESGGWNHRESLKLV